MNRLIKFGGTIALLMAMGLVMAISLSRPSQARPNPPDDGLDSESPIPEAPSTNYAWHKTVQVNDTIINGTLITPLRAGDIITIVDKVVFTATGTITFSLSEAWSEALTLSGYGLSTPTIKGNKNTGILTGTRVLTWAVNNGSSTGDYLITKTFHALSSTSAADFITETLWLEGASPQPVPVILEFQRPVTSESKVFLPLIANRFPPPPPEPPVISNISSYHQTLNACSFFSGPPGTDFGVAFDFTDANGDVSTSVPDGTLTITFMPANDTFTYGFDEFDGAGPDNGYSGRIYVDGWCIRFGSQSYIRVTVILEDNQGLQSNPLTIDIPKPAGANSREETVPYAISPKP